MDKCMNTETDTMIPPIRKNCVEMHKTELDVRYRYRFVAAFNY